MYTLSVPSLHDAGSPPVADATDGLETSGLPKEVPFPSGPTVTSSLVLESSQGPENGMVECPSSDGINYTHLLPIAGIEDGQTQDRVCDGAPFSLPQSLPLSSSYPHLDEAHDGENLEHPTSEALRV